MPSAPVLTLPREVHALVDDFDVTRASQDVMRLCSHSFGGRRVGTPGHARAQGWLVERLQHLGFETSIFEFSIDMPVLDVYALPTLTIVTEDGTVLTTFKHRREFSEHPSSADRPQATNGIARHWQDGATVHGTWVILDAVPPGDDLTIFVERMAQRGAVGILAPLYPDRDGYLSKRIVARSTVALPVLSVRADVLPHLEGTRIRATAPVRPVTLRGGHVLGRLSGTDRALTNAPLLVGAHYDGVGDDMGGHRLPCAADNAAAVAVILELARILVSITARPLRPIVFAAFDAEEVEAYGSWAYAQSLKNQGVTPLVLNLDGAAELGEEIWVEAGPQTDVLVSALDAAGQWLETLLVMGPVGSDNRRFANASIPAVGISAGGSSGHSPADVPTRVDAAAMTTTGRLLLTTIWRLAY